jgi:enoyl-CoA hydratase/carnithine racemase
MLAALQAAMDEAEGNDTVRVIVIAASGKLFSAGHDLKQMTSHRTDPDRGEAYFKNVFGICSRLMQSIVNHPKPVSAVVDGVATAAGCPLVASCDLSIASDRAKFGVNGIDVGLFCTTPAVALTRVVSRKCATELLLTGEMIDAATAAGIGLVNRVVPHDSLTVAVNEMAAIIAAKPPAAVKLGKAALLRQAGMDLADAYDLASSVMVENLLAADAEEGINAFLEKRSPGWRM